MQTKLSVNINKVAWLRNARNINVPNVLQFAVDCERYGADGITVHPRQDERHIKKQDVRDLAERYPSLECEFNIEGFPSDDFIQMVIDVCPTQCTLVPDDPNQITSDHGWDTITHASLLTEVIQELKTHNIRTSLFMDPVDKWIEGAAKVGADRIEYYTGPYSEMYPVDREKAIKEFRRTASFASNIGLGINAGHDLNLDNLLFFKQHIPNLLEVSIGHALIKDCLYFGLENTIQLYKRLL